ncbi:hypothetical protein IEQ34_011014 [Dendrobium chrysotoxum]|uniref:Uncharacterized protein n=1 Tax=Dendrobium chrysotoxum TaxID=161865 RepID=A0AAV7GUC5_DENCH|nr:hypothetical protein IEQ34_011014 [Dendrobium chrysotoxum]
MQIIAHGNCKRSLCRQTSDRRSAVASADGQRNALKKFCLAGAIVVSGPPLLRRLVFSDTAAEKRQKFAGTPSAPTLKRGSHATGARCRTFLPCFKFLKPKKQMILESRKRLDNALSLPDLVNEDSIASLVKEQLIQSSSRSNREDVGKILESRTIEVANFLEMLRSASGTSNPHLKFQKDWKVKQDTDELRVMYCEGPHGSPFHTLLAEGFADGSMDVCLCVSWESTLYKKWWPQYNVPTFKIIASLCLQKVRIGEEISLIRQNKGHILYMCSCLCFLVLTFTCIKFQERVKVPWPVSDREAVVHYFEIEYFKEDLILVLIKTLSDTEHIDVDTHGFNGDGIPQAKDTIRIDLVGGFVLQKVESNRCYFRAIFNFDIKLELIPPSLINFISRQLLGNGHKLYQKAVGSVATIDEDYRLALQGPLYARIRQQLHTGIRPATYSEDMEKEKLAFLDEHKADAPAKDNVIKTRTLVPEITEEDTEPRADTEAKNHIANGSSGNMVVNKQGISTEEKASISPEVEHALEILDQVISMVRGQSIGLKNCRKPSLVGEDFPISELGAKAGLLNNEDVPESSNSKLKLNIEGSPHTDDHRQNNTNSLIIDADHHHVVLSSGKEIFSDSVNSKMMESRINFPENLPSKDSVRMTQLSTLDSTCKVCDEESIKANGFYNSGGPLSGKTKTMTKTKKKRKKLSLCCLSPSFISD